MPLVPNSPRTALTYDIGVDLDGVGYDYVDAQRQWLHRLLHRPLDSMPAYTCWSFFDTDWGMTAADFFGAANDSVDAGYLFRVGEPMPGFVDGLARLTAAGHRVHIITDRARVGSPGNAERNTTGWLEDIGAEYSTLTFSGDKTVVNCDLFIDDRPENWLSLVAAGVDAFLRDHSYNRHVPAPADRRVASFDEFVTAVESMTGRTKSSADTSPAA